MRQLQQVRQTVADRTSDLVVTAIGFLGVPYRRGGNTAETGFDCSGFVRAMYNQTVGHLLPRRAEEQAAATAEDRPQDLKPGDLVFFNTMRAPSAMSASMSAKASSSIPPSPAPRCGSKT